MPLCVRAVHVLWGAVHERYRYGLHKVPVNYFTRFSSPKAMRMNISISAIAPIIFLFRSSSRTSSGDQQISSRPAKQRAPSGASPISGSYEGSMNSWIVLQTVRSSEIFAPSTHSLWKATSAALISLRAVFLLLPTVSQWGWSALLAAAGWSQSPG